MRHDPDVEEDSVTFQHDSLGRWVVGVVSAAIIGGLALFATSERADFQERLKQHEVAIQRMAVFEYRLNEQHTRLERIESKLDLILERQSAKKRSV